MERLSVPEGLCLIRFSDPSETPPYLREAGASYEAVSREVWYLFGSPVGGELNALAHEVCHAHQHRAVLDAGLPVKSNRGWGDENSWGLSWIQTQEGKDFIETTGWHLENGTWIEQAEPWSSGYANPLEDAAELCATWYNPGNAKGNLGGPAYLSNYAPLRYQWAQQWLSP